MPQPSIIERRVRVHPTAVVDDEADLGVDVEIGPYAVVERGVRVGDRTRLMAHVHVSSGTEIGPDCEVFVGAALGQRAQIRDLTGAGGGLIIGARNVIREHVTIHRSSQRGNNTAIGDDNFLLAGCHVAHDCQVGDGTTVANGALLAGCVTLGDRAFVSGNVVIHQHVQIGELSMIGGNARVSKDVPPFMLVVGDTMVRGVNIVGLRRAGMSADRRQIVKEAYRVLYRSGLNVTHAVSRLRELPRAPEVDTLIEFIQQSRRGLCAGGPPGRRLSAADE
jgi:UDP-N-acetylglucosamine acyltransferase